MSVKDAESKIAQTGMCVKSEMFSELFERYMSKVQIESNVHCARNFS